MYAWILCCSNSKKKIHDLSCHESYIKKMELRFEIASGYTILSPLLISDLGSVKP